MSTNHHRVNVCLQTSKNYQYFNLYKMIGFMYHPFFLIIHGIKFFMYFQQVTLFLNVNGK